MDAPRLQASSATKPSMVARNTCHRRPSALRGAGSVAGEDGETSADIERGPSIEVTREPPWRAAPGRLDAAGHGRGPTWGGGAAPRGGTPDPGGAANPGRSTAARRGHRFRPAAVRHPARGRDNPPPQEGHGWL